MTPASPPLPALPGPPVTVNVWQLPTKEARTVEERADLAVMRRFLELHPNLRMEGFRGVMLTASGLALLASLSAWWWIRNKPAP